MRLKSPVASPRSTPSSCMTPFPSTMCAAPPTPIAEQHARCAPQASDTAPPSPAARAAPRAGGEPAAAAAESASMRRRVLLVPPSQDGVARERRAPVVFEFRSREQRVMGDYQQATASFQQVMANLLGPQHVQAQIREALLGCRYGEQLQLQPQQQQTRTQTQEGGEAQRGGREAPGPHLQQGHHNPKPACLPTAASPLASSRCGSVPALPGGESGDHVSRRRTSSQGQQCVPGVAPRLSSPSKPSSQRTVSCHPVPPVAATCPPQHHHYSALPLQLQRSKQSPQLRCWQPVTSH